MKAEVRSAVTNETPTPAGPVREIDIARLDLAPLVDVIGQAPLDLLHDTIQNALEAQGSGRVWNINSTEQGGGVAEMLQSIVAYCRGLDLDVRWLVIDGNDEFFTITKRLHNRLHGSTGDGGALGDREHSAYVRLLERCSDALLARIRPGDAVICHDPQTAGLIPLLIRHGARVIWRCHIGHDERNEHVQEGWRFLQPFVLQADACVFSRRAYVPTELDPQRCFIIQPSIDPLSPKNQPLDDESVASILAVAGLINAQHAPPERAQFTRRDGRVDVVRRAAQIESFGSPPDPQQPLVVQVSRWDRLKDHLGVLRTWDEHRVDHDSALVLAGPEASSVADDPEGAAALDEVRQAWADLPRTVRRRVHIACLPMADVEENAAIVNALQRHARIIVQKSLYEGFGLTVTEGMWKARPVVASGVGGIRDQIVHRSTGWLIDDPHDLSALAEAVQQLLDDDRYADELGSAARRHVRENFLFLRSLQQYATMFMTLDGRG